MKEGKRCFREKVGKVVVAGGHRAREAVIEEVKALLGFEAKVSRSGVEKDTHDGGTVTRAMKSFSDATSASKVIPFGVAG